MQDEGSLVSFDTDRVLAVARSTTDDSVLVVGEVTPTDYRLVYVDRVIEERFESVDGTLRETADALGEYESLDFFEREALADMIPTVDDVRAFTTFTDRAIITRIVAAEEGVYVSVEPGTDVTELVRAVEPIVRDWD